MASKNRQLQLSVIIVNYNVRDFLNHALLSLLKACRGIPTEYIVVDNASDDGSVDMVRKRFPGVTVIANKDNVGFAKANNIALKRARGKYLLLINPDTVIQEDTLKVILKFFEENKDAGAAGCKIINPDGSFQLACRRSFPTPWVAFTKIMGLSRLFARSSLFGKYNLTYLSPDETYEVDAVSGSFMMLRREVYERVGGLDEEFFMYGEDLDWCYRIQKAGWKIYYVHSTQIIHFKGESTRRSNLDEIQTFYSAMHLFVKKHFGTSFLLHGVLRLGIVLTSFGALLRSVLRPIAIGLIDFAVVDASILLGEYIWRGRIFSYPSYAYPIVFVIPAVLVVAALYAAGVYTRYRTSIFRSALAVLSSYVLIASLTAFFKEYAFSRMVLAISGGISVLSIPGWRLFLRISGGAAILGGINFAGKRTLIVGTDSSARELLRKLREQVAHGYDVVGFIDRTRRHIGEEIDGVSIVGSVENVGKVIREHRVSDVIFSTKEVSYAEILPVISRVRQESVNFHLVPSTLEVIIGKSSVDALEEFPLVQISYNIDRAFNRVTKRMLDLVISTLLFILVYPILAVKKALIHNSESRFILSIPSVIKGQNSLVGPPEKTLGASSNGQISGGVNLGKPGLTGLVQLQRNRTLSESEVDHYNLYYARNQSVVLDLEILLKTWLKRRLN